jgi:V8-like Glu-specific endopeptidase
MQLQGDQFGRIHKAIERTFNRAGLDRLLVERFGLSLESLTGNVGFSDQVTDVTRHFNQYSIAEDFVASLREARVREADFTLVSDELKVTDISRSDLEVFVRDNTFTFQDVADFRTKLQMRENTVCRIETPDGSGTGVLIGDKRVLTSFHVIDGHIESDLLVKKGCKCIFGYKKSGAGPLVSLQEVAIKSVLVHSAIDPNDLIPDGVATDKTLLDYAVLELEYEISILPIVAGGDLRGYVQINFSCETPAVKSPLVILQHPHAKPMKIDFGMVVATPGSRLRHSVSTLGGSSGAPVFDTELNLVAIHQGGFDKTQVLNPYNKSIPLPLIIEHAASKLISL